MKVFEGIYAYVWGTAFRDVSNAYVLKRENIILIDPGRYKSFANLFGLMRNDGMSVRNVDIVLNTHLHLDHCESNSMFKRYGALMSFYGKKEMKPDISPFELAKMYDFEIIHTPGHTPDSITIYLPEHEIAICGDLIFENGLPGRTDLYDSNKEDMQKSLEIVQSYEPKYLFPGHGRVVEGRSGIKALFEKALVILDKY